MSEAKTKNVKTITAQMEMFDPFAKDSDYITITEWESGEGWHISFADNRSIEINLNELDAINILVKTMDLGLKIESDE